MCALRTMIRSLGKGWHDMDFHFHLTDEEATKLWGRLQHLQGEIKGMAGNDDKATVNAWWILHRLREIDNDTVWMAKQEDLESLFPEVDLSDGQ